MACGLSVVLCASPAARDAAQSADSGRAPADAPDTRCSALAGLDLPDARILSATRETEPAAHCKVTGLIGGRIGFKVWLPAAWNGRFVMGGAGGFVNTDANQALDLFGERILTDGYASASTDTGHAVPNARDGTWALGDWEAIVNYAHLGMHRAVVHAKRASRRRNSRRRGRTDRGPGSSAPGRARRCMCPGMRRMWGVMGVTETGVGATYSPVVQDEPANDHTEPAGRLGGHRARALRRHGSGGRTPGPSF